MGLLTLAKLAAKPGLVLAEEIQIETVWKGGFIADRFQRKASAISVADARL
jgi:hypothetical protein